MIRTAFVALSLGICATAFAQSSEFGVLVGGSKRLSRGSDRFKFSDSVREIYYAVQLDPGTKFKIKAGQIEGPVRFADTAAGELPKGRIEHIDGIVDYRFSEAFGSTGLFAGVGLYRQRANGGGTDSETNYGFTGGVNGDFPLSRRTGVVIEAAYHWINFDVRARYVTLGGGLRFTF